MGRTCSAPYSTRTRSDYSYIPGTRTLHASLLAPCTRPCPTPTLKTLHPFILYPGPTPATRLLHSAPYPLHPASPADPALSSGTPTLKILPLHPFILYPGHTSVIPRHTPTPRILHSAAPYTPAVSARACYPGIPKCTRVRPGRYPMGTHGYIYHWVPRVPYLPGVWRHRGYSTSIMYNP